MLLTNASALTAIQSLRAADRAVDVTQQRIASGLKVASADDNAAFFLVANTQRGDIVRLEGTRDNLNVALGAIDAAQSAEPLLNDIINNIAAAVTTLETGAAEVELAAVINEQVDIARDVIQNTSYNGINLLDERQIVSVDAGAIRQGEGLFFPQIEVLGAGLGKRPNQILSPTPPFPGAVLDFNDGGNGGLVGTNVPTQAGVNTGGPFEEKTFGIAFETGDNIEDLQVLYEQGGGIRGLNISIENGNLQFGAYNAPIDGGAGNWGYLEVEATVQANTRYTAQLVLDGDPSGANNGTMRVYLDGILVDTVGGVGLLYNHGNSGAIGQIGGNQAVLNGVSTPFSAATVFQGEIDKVIQYNDAYSGADFDQVSGYLAESWLPVGSIQYYIGNPARIETATLLELLEAVDPTQDGFTTGGALEVLEAARSKLNTAFAEIGFSERRLERQQNYLDGLASAMEEGVAALVEADLQEESSRIQAFEVRAELARQSLFIANQRPQSILRLFN